MITHRLRERTGQIGTWISLGSSVVAELAADSGFDWLLFDLEHGCGTTANLLPQLQALRGTKAASVVRVGAPHPELIGQVLDWGADAIMVPHVSSPQEASACVRAMRYPPAGIRGVSRSVRAYGYGLQPFEPVEPVLFAQIETLAAVECARSIAAVDGVDVLFIGPSDLRSDLGQRAAGGEARFDQCITSVLEAAAAMEKAAGILVRERADAKRRLAQGFTHVAIESDLSILREGYRQLLASGSLREPVE